MVVVVAVVVIVVVGGGGGGIGVKRVIGAIGGVAVAGVR